MMLFAITIGLRLASITKVLLEGWVHDKLLSN
jgi:hypothetical protein